MSDVNHERFLHMKSYASQTEDKIQVDKKVQYDRSLFTRDKNVETTEEFALINEAVNEDREAFEKYSCYYCDNVITSESQLSEHIEKCRGSNRMFCTSPVGLSYQFYFRKPPLRHHSSFSLLGVLGHHF